MCQSVNCLAVSSVSRAQDDESQADHREGALREGADVKNRFGAIESLQCVQRTAAEAKLTVVVLFGWITSSGRAVTSGNGLHPYATAQLGPAHQGWEAMLSVNLFLH